MHSVNALLFSTAYTTYGLYVVRAAGLGPLELVLTGTALELAVVLGEVPTGIVADIYSRRLSVIVGFGIIGVGMLLMRAVPTFPGIAVASALGHFAGILLGVALASTHLRLPMLVSAWVSGGSPVSWRSRCPSGGSRRHRPPDAACGR